MCVPFPLKVLANRHLIKKAAKVMEGRIGLHWREDRLALHRPTAIKLLAMVLRIAQRSNYRTRAVEVKSFILRKTILARITLMPIAGRLY